VRIYFWIIRIGRCARTRKLSPRKGQIVLLRSIETLLGEAISNREIYDAEIDSLPFMEKGITKFNYADIRYPNTSIYCARNYTGILSSHLVKKKDFFLSNRKEFIFPIEIKREHHSATFLNLYHRR